jgi:hypothetical protein
MENQIKNFIEEGEKSFDKKWVKLFEEGSWPMIGIELKQFISSRQISLIKMIVEDTILELGKINFLEDITGEENRKLTLERYRKFRDTISSKLKAIIE